MPFQEWSARQGGWWGVCCGCCWWHTWLSTQCHLWQLYSETALSIHCFTSKRCNITDHWGKQILDKSTELGSDLQLGGFFEQAKIVNWVNVLLRSRHTCFHKELSVMLAFCTNVKVYASARLCLFCLCMTYIRQIEAVNLPRPPSGGYNLSVCTCVRNYVHDYTQVAAHHAILPSPANAVINNTLSHHLVGTWTSHWPPLLLFSSFAHLALWCFALVTY